MRMIKMLAVRVAQLLNRFKKEGKTMSEDKQVAPFMEIQESGTNIDLAVQQAQKMTEILDAMNIEKATFRTGAKFHRDPKTSR